MSRFLVAASLAALSLAGCESMRVVPPTPSAREILGRAAIAAPKFRYGDTVIITGGFHEGRTGVVSSFHGAIGEYGVIIRPSQSWEYSRLFFIHESQLRKSEPATDRQP